MTNPLVPSKFMATVTGPSCSGKTDLLKEFLDSGLYGHMTSCTTRPPRLGEVHGKDYFFMTKEEFKALEAKKGFVQTVEFRGEFYGTPVTEVERVETLGLVPIVVVEPSGVTEFLNFSIREGYKLVSIYVDTNSTYLLDRYLARMPDASVSKEEFVHHATRIAGMSKEADEWFKDTARRALGNPGKAFLLAVTNNDSLEEFRAKCKKLAPDVVQALECSGGIAPPYTWGSKGVDLSTPDAPEPTLTL